MAEFTGFKPTWEKHHHDAPTTGADIHAQRLTDGQCPTCGAQTHEFIKKGIVLKSKTKVPLTELGATQRGRCLLCHPITVSDSQISTNTSTRSPMYFGGASSIFSSSVGGISSPPAPPPLSLPAPPPPQQTYSSPAKTANKKTKTIVTPTLNSSTARKMLAKSTKLMNRSADPPPPSEGIFANVVRDSRTASERTMENILDMGSCVNCSSWGKRRNFNKKWNRRTSWYS